MVSTRMFVTLAAEFDVRKVSVTILVSQFFEVPLAMAAQSKAWVCVLSLTGTACSNPA
jgi:hypothetical protein